MKNIGRKRTKGLNFELIADKKFINLQEFMEFIGYSPTNRASFHRLKDKGQIPVYFCVGGSIYFNVDKVIKFYSETLPQRQKTVLRASLLEAR